MYFRCKCSKCVVMPKAGECLCCTEVEEIKSLMSGEVNCILVIREGSEFTGWEGGGLYFSASKIKSAPLPEAKKIPTPLPEKMLPAHLHDFTIEQ